MACQTLSPVDIFGYCIDAGFSQDQALVGTAIVLAESGGYTCAVNPSDHNVVGMWQIKIDQHPDVSRNQAFDPAQSSAAALRIYKNNGGWHPWSTYPNAAGKYAQTAATAQIDYDLNHGDLGRGVQQTIVDPAATAVKNALGDFFGPIVTRVAGALLNGVLVIGGAALMLGGIAIVALSMRGKAPDSVRGLRQAVGTQAFIRRIPK